jgi:hypothetical protein
MTLVLALQLAAGLVLAGFLVDRLLLWMEWRGWIDYRRTDPGRIHAGQIGPAFLAIQGLLEPDKKHAAEEQTRLRTERDAQGDGDGEETSLPRPRRD